MKKISWMVPVLFCSLFAGCATANKPMYSWGDYSSSLYSVKKDASDDNVTKHKQVLLRIMDDSKEKGLRVPPGVYCEYGYILIKEGKADDALSYLDLEEQTYPESKVFIQRLKSQVAQKKERP